MFARVKAFIGDLWGATTTQGLALLVGVQPVLATVDPTLFADAPWLRWAIFGVSIGIVVFRWAAPPPPSLPIKPEDGVHVDGVNNTVTVIKGGDIPANIVTKAPT